MIGRGKNQAKKHERAQQLFLESVEALGDTPDQLVAAVNIGLERVFDQLVRQACEEVGLEPEAFSAELERDDARRAEVQRRIAAVFSADNVERARVEAQRRDVERHLYVLRYVLSGKEPADWVWESMDEDEQERLRTFREAGGEEDPEVLRRVEHALEKLGSGQHAFGHCESCGQPISGERLQLIPYAERCTTCQLEREGAAPNPSATPKVPLMMFFERGKPVPPEKRLVR